MIEHYNTLRPLISNWIHNEMHCTSNSVVDEVHLSASSLVRKDFIKNKITNLINKYDLDLKIIEGDGMELTDRFIIVKK